MNISTHRLKWLAKQQQLDIWFQEMLGVGFDALGEEGLSLQLVSNCLALNGNYKRSQANRNNVFASHCGAWLQIGIV